MITIEQVQQRIEEVAGENIAPFDILESNRRSKEVARLRQILMFLDTNPSEESLRIRLEILEKRHDSIYEQAEYYRKNRAPKMAKKIEKERGMPEVKSQIKTLKYILNG